jgi:hypothetical protein
MVDVGCALRRCALPDRLLGDGLAEGDARHQRLHIFSSARSARRSAHAVMDAARPEAALRDLEAAAFAEQHVGGRHAHVVERTSAWPCGASS